MSKPQLALDLSLRPAQGRDDFLVAPCNRAAVGWIDRWPDWPGVGVALWGGPGSGKTHLAEVWRAGSNAVRLGPDDLTPDRLDQLVSLCASALVDFGERGLPSDFERPLLHLHNRLWDQGRTLLLVSRLPPARWDVELPDLRSRLNAIAAVRIDEPDEALLGALLVKLFADRQLRVAPDVITYALPRIERSFATIRRLVDTVDQTALAAGRAVTVPLVRDALAATAGRRAPG